MEQKLLRILQNCKSIKQLNQTHLQILIHGLHNNNVLTFRLIKLFSHFNSLGSALHIFKNASSPNVFVYNTMIEGYIQNSRRTDAFLTYNLMNSSSISPNSFTFTFLLNSCKTSKDFVDGAMTHTQIVKLGFGGSVFVKNTLLEFYSKCGGNLELVKRVFDEMPDRDVVSWNTIMSAYMAHGERDLVKVFFDSMPERNVVSWNSMLTWLSKDGDMDAAESVFERMPARNEISWNAMISGYLRNGDVSKASLVFDSMPDKSAVSWTVMVLGYAKVGDVRSAYDIFHSIPVKNVISWNAMIAAYVQNKMFDEALDLFHQMLRSGKCRPSEATLVSVLSACAHLAALEQGKWVDSYIQKNGYYLDNVLGNALMDMFAKCGDIQKALEAFHRMTERERCIITWTTMVSGLAVNGRCREALSFFDTMCRQRLKPDDVIFISVLSACTHGGLVEEGKCVFHQMVAEFGIQPRIEHYGCMVDLLSRAGRVEEAYKFVMTMPMEPNAVIWATLLGSCKVHGKGELAEIITKKLHDLDHSNPGHITLISNVNASVGQWQDVMNIRAAMRKEGVEKLPGCSSIQVGPTVHEFLVMDTTNERSEEIYITLHVLNDQSKSFGDICY